MIVRLSQFMLAFISATCVFSQFSLAPDVRAQERSHVERFSTPEARAERVEAEANQKLAAKPNDTEALNLRGLARIRFGRYPEAYKDLSRAVALKPDNSDYQA